MAPQQSSKWEKRLRGVSNRLCGPITHRPPERFIGEMRFWFTTKSCPHQMHILLSQSSFSEHLHLLFKALLSSHYGNAVIDKEFGTGKGNGPWLIHI